MEKQADRVAPPLSKIEQTIAHELVGALGTMQKAAGSATTSIGLLFAPGVTKLVDAITNAIVKNREAIFNFASAIADKVKPIIDDIIATLEGRDKDVKNSAFIAARDAVISFGTSAKSAFNDIIIPAVKALNAALGVLAQALNGLFGTNLNAQVLAIAIAFTSFTGILGATVTGIKGVVIAFQLLGAVLTSPQLALVALGVAFALFLVNAAGGITGLQAAWTTAWDAISSAATAVFGALQSAGQTVVSAFTSAGQGIVSFFTGLPGTLQQAFTALATAVQSVWDGIVNGAKAVGDGLASAFNSAVDTVKGAFQSLYDGASRYLKQLLDSARALAAAIGGVFGGGGGTAEGHAAGGLVRFAGGGHVRGPGTATSDSIPARLSNNEYVVRAAAVRHYGVRLLDALNSMRLSVSGARSLLGGVDLSSFARTMAAPLSPGGVQRFATGGLALAPAVASSGGTFNLVIDGKSFGGLSGPANVMDELQRFATRNRLLSGGRKPRYFGA
jgi:phage-related protein